MLAAAYKRMPSSYVSLADTLPACAPANDHRYPYPHHLAYARVPGSKLYEEFHPFGTTAYAANDSGIEVSAKRYRYIGKERDEETGLYQCGARYLAAWLGRWAAADPIGLGDGVNRYAYARGNPVKLVDATGTIGTLSVLQQPNTARLALAKQIGYRQGVYSATVDPVEQNRLLSEIAALQTELDRLTTQTTSRTSRTKSDQRSPRPRTTGEIEAKVYRELQGELAKEDAEHYNRPLVSEFLPGIGIWDLPHDAAQLGAAIDMGDEARATETAWRVAVDVITTVVDVATAGSGRGGTGPAKTALRAAERKGVQLAAQGGSGAVRAEVKGATGGPAAPRSALHPDVAPYADPAPPKYRGESVDPSLPVQDHIRARALGGHPSDPENLHTKAWEENARKGGHEGSYLRQRDAYIRGGLTEKEAEETLEAYLKWIENDIHARPVDPALLDKLPSR